MQPKKIDITHKVIEPKILSVTIQKSVEKKTEVKKEPQIKPKPQIKKKVKKRVKKKIIIPKKKTKPLLHKKELPPKIDKKISEQKKPIIQKLDTKSRKNQKEQLRHKDALKQKWLALLRKEIQKNKRYPYKAQRRKQQGTVLLKLVVRANGSLVKTLLIHSSGHKTLDRDALKLIDKIFPFKAFDKNSLGDILEIDIPINYILKEKK